MAFFSSTYLSQIIGYPIVIPLRPKSQFFSKLNNWQLYHVPLLCVLSFFFEYIYIYLFLKCHHPLFLIFPPPYTKEFIREKLKQYKLKIVKNYLDISNVWQRSFFARKFLEKMTCNWVSKLMGIEYKISLSDLVAILSIQYII